MMKLIWQGPGNLSLGSRMYGPGEALELDEAAFEAIDRDVLDRFEVVAKPAPAPEPAPEQDEQPAPQPSKRKRR